MTWTVLEGDAKERLAEMEPESVQCVVTSPPYWGLRDYGTEGQLGLEPTPEAYVSTLVEVFREVRRVLAKDGTVWLNLGDSYGAFGGNTAIGLREAQFGKGNARGHAVEARQAMQARAKEFTKGLKPKDLVGIPWMLAKALQQPYYVGRIKAEADRAWLAGWLDGEGTITFVERDRGPDHTSTHDVRVFFTNCDRGPMDEFAALFGGRVNMHDDGTRENRYGSRPVYRWQMGTHDGALLLRELYPYLRTKRQQAALIWTLYTTLRHKNGHARTPSEVVARRQEIAGMVRSLNAGGSVTLPAWVTPPPSPTEEGWYLRADVIWSKPNPMPESVTDRPTKAHEYLFLLTKSARYFYDAEAVRESNTAGTLARLESGPVQAFSAPNGKRAIARGDSGGEYLEAAGRNLRSVWNIPTEPFPQAHFATFPKALVEPCIKAGTSEKGNCPECGKPWVRVTTARGNGEAFTMPHRDTGRPDGADRRNIGGGQREWNSYMAPVSLGWRPTCSHDTEPTPAVVLDPFCGSGTTGVVALRLGRRFVGIELNLTYAEMARRRITDDAPLFNTLEVAP